MPGSNSSAHASAPDALPEPLTMTVHSIAAPTLADEEARSRTRRGRVRMLLVLLACAAPVIASYLAYFVIRPEGGSTAYGTLILPTKSLPELALTDLDGRAVPARSLRGQWLLVAVGPAACDAACEQRLFMQRQLREMLGRERDRLDKVWLITDTAPLAEPLRAALTAAPAVTLLRAEAAAVAAWLAPEPGHTLEQHLYIVDPMGEWMMRVPADPEPSRVKRDLDRLLRASAFWDRAGR